MPARRPCELLFRDPVEAVRETVAEIKANEDVDMIVCVSHSGTWEDESKSEDEILAKSVPDLDLIISGHTHTELAEPDRARRHVYCIHGEYGRKIGELSMNPEERWQMGDNGIISWFRFFQTITADGATQEKIDGFMEAVDTGYLADFGYTKDEVLATNNVQFSTLHDLEYEHTDTIWVT